MADKLKSNKMRENRLPFVFSFLFFVAYLGLLITFASITFTDIFHLYPGLYLSLYLGFSLSLASLLIISFISFSKKRALHRLIPPVSYSRSDDALLSWRIWTVTAYGLSSLNSFRGHELVWQSKFFHAKHNEKETVCNKFERCGCGIYSLHNINQAFKTAVKRSEVGGICAVGLIRNYNKVIVHRHGIRSSDVEIIGLISPQELINKYEQFSGSFLSSKKQDEIQKILTSYSNQYEIPLMSTKGLEELGSEYGNFWTPSNLTPMSGFHLLARSKEAT